MAIPSLKTSKFGGDYKAVSSVVVAPAGTGIFAALSGSASDIIKIKKIKVSGIVLTAVGYITVLVNKYSGVPTGGTAVALNKVPLSSAFPASDVALANTYTVAPTPVGLLGAVASQQVMGQSSTAVASALPATVEFNFGDEEEITLLSAAECIGLTFAVAPATAVSLTVEISYSEFAQA